VPGPAQLRELSRSEFLTELETLLAIYAAAMQAEAAYLPGRVTIMERHAGYPGFAALVAVAPLDPPPAAAAVPGAAAAAPLPGAVAGGTLASAAGPVGGTAARAGSSIVAFAYGFRGATGQWWHDVVSSGVTAASGPHAATRWLADTMEIAEVHVRPEYQRQGIGRRLLLTLTADRTERTAVLSTQDSNSPARRLYRSLGFTDLLTTFAFPGGGPPYAVMGAPLPLIGAARTTPGP
jgi:GNAT superfamily N-acetyltransferase